MAMPNHRGELAQQQHDRQRHGADDECAAMRVAEVGDDVPELLEEVVAAFLDAEQLGNLSDDDRQCETDDEALEDRLGDEVGDEPEP
jgi:hypothetical protein